MLFYRHPSGDGYGEERRKWRLGELEIFEWRGKPRLRGIFLAEVFWLNVKQHIA